MWVVRIELELIFSKEIETFEDIDCIAETRRI